MDRSSFKPSPRVVPAVPGAAAKLLEADAALRDALRGFRPGGRVAKVVAPLEYAWAGHEAYVRRYGDATGRDVLVGMNPGFWGMAQTGIPFADPETARAWMGLSADVAAPAATHPRLPVRGFASTRPDPSGRRLYGWARSRFGSAEAFFAAFYVDNYCPLLFLDESGSNVTPDKLRKEDRLALQVPCDAHARALVAALRPRRLLGLGAYVTERLRALDLGVPVEGLLHPSPANPRNNQGWGVDF